MKILLATFWVTPHVGGVWNYMRHLKERLESSGHEVDLLAYGEDSKYVHIINENRRMYKEQILTEINAMTNQQFLPYIKNPVVKFYEFYRNFYTLGATYLGLDKYDLIHTQDVISTACINRVKPEKTPLVATLHGCVAHELNHYVTHVNKTATSHLACEYFNKLEYEGATSADITITANQWLKNILTEEFQVPDEQIKIYHYGYDIETFQSRMKESTAIQRPAQKKVIMYAGRLAELKGVNHLITALSLLKKERNDWVCWIVGDGNKSEELKKQSKDLGLEKDVLFFGNRDDVPSLLVNSDLFILPSLLENQPLSVIEAQIAGKAVIVSDAGGLPEIVEHGMTGVISPKGDPHLLSININYLLEHEDYMNNLGSRAQKWGLDHWSLDRAVKNTLEVYQYAINKKENK